MGQRRRARIQAVQVLYAIAFSGQPLTDALVGYLEMLEPAAQSKLHHFTMELLERAQENREEIDRRLAGAVEHWQPERIASVDRQILRAAVCEILYFEEIPPKVSINEYIEVARKLSGDDSAAFVNGVLDRIAHDIYTRSRDSVESPGDG